jgi:hypothetical protein
VILKMGTKDVLVKTRSMEWGTDSVQYRSLQEMEQHLPGRLSEGARVLKQHRGNGGNGVWKVEYVAAPPFGLDAMVRVLHAQRNSRLEHMRLGDFIERCKAYYANDGSMIDQPYQARLGEGMIRCYLVKDRVAGFGHQYVTALLPLPHGATESPTPPPRLYYGPGKAEFQRLKAKLESGWVSEMQRLLDIAPDELPLLWDADFLLGPRDPSGEDTYVLCEINISSVYPFPDEALSVLAEAVSSKLETHSLR